MFANMCFVFTNLYFLDCIRRLHHLLARLRIHERSHHMHVAFQSHNCWQSLHKRSCKPFLLTHNNLHNSYILCSYRESGPYILHNLLLHHPNPIYHKHLKEKSRMVFGLIHRSKIEPETYVSHQLFFIPDG